MFVFILKEYPENFAFVILRILELFTCKFVNFLKSGLIFNISYSFWMCTHLKKIKGCFNGKSPTYYFHIRTKILADFQICISVPLKKNSRFVLQTCRISGLKGFRFKQWQKVCLPTRFTIRTVWYTFLDTTSKLRY